jgi:hypothetical protein
MLMLLVLCASVVGPGPANWCLWRGLIRRAIGRSVSVTGRGSVRPFGLFPACDSIGSGKPVAQFLGGPYSRTSSVSFLGTVDKKHNCWWPRSTSLAAATYNHNNDAHGGFVLLSVALLASLASASFALSTTTDGVLDAVPRRWTVNLDLSPEQR